jgi:hypothetical protein
MSSIKRGESIAFSAKARKNVNGLEPRTVSWGFQTGRLVAAVILDVKLRVTAQTYDPAYTFDGLVREFRNDANGKTVLACQRDCAVPLADFLYRSVTGFGKPEPDVVGGGGLPFHVDDTGPTEDAVVHNYYVFLGPFKGGKWFTTLSLNRVTDEWPDASAFTADIGLRCLVVRDEIGSPVIAAGMKMAYSETEIKLPPCDAYYLKPKTTETFADIERILIGPKSLEGVELEDVERYWLTCQGLPWNGVVPDSLDDLAHWLQNRNPVNINLNTEGNWRYGYAIRNSEGIAWDVKAPGAQPSQPTKGKPRSTYGPSSRYPSSRRRPSSRQRAPQRRGSSRGRMGGGMGFRESYEVHEV